MLGTIRDREGKTPLTLERWDRETSLMRLDCPFQGQRVALLHPDALDDLVADLRLAARAMLGCTVVKDGQQLDGYTIVATDRLSPAGDGCTNALVCVSGSETVVRRFVTRRRHGTQRHPHEEQPAAGR